MPHLLAGRRALDAAAVAERYRLSYDEVAAPTLTRRPISLFALGDGQLAENSMTGVIRGSTVHSFDVVHLDGDRPFTGLPDGFPAVCYEGGNLYTGALVPMAVSLEMVHISRRGLRALFDANEATALDIGHRRFLRRHQVWAADPRSAAAIVGDELLEVMAATEGRFVFEWHHDAVVCVGRSVKPDEVPALMALTVSVAELVRLAVTGVAEPTDLPPPLPPPPPHPPGPWYLAEPPATS